MGSIIVDGVKYVQEQPYDRCDKKYCIVRADSAGVFAGWIDIKSVSNGCGIIYDSRRLWRWAGAASLSQLSVDGVSKPDECKFPCVVAETILFEIIEIIPCTEKAIESINGVKVWSA